MSAFRSQINISQIISQLQAAQDQANAANETRYQEALTTLRGGFGRSEELIRDIGGTAARRIATGTQRLGASLRQDLTSRGLGSTTILAAVQRGVQEQGEEQMLAVDEARRTALSGLQERAAGSISNLIASRFDQGPDAGLYSQLLSQAAATPTQPLQARVGPGSSTFGRITGTSFGGGGGGGDVTHWTDAHPELKGNAVLRRYDTELDAHKGHLEARKVMSDPTDPLRLPKSLDKATDEQKAEWNASVGKIRGVPDKAEDYDLKPPKDLPEGVKIDEESVKAVKEMAKELHVPRANLQAFYEFQLNMIAKQLEAHSKANEKASKDCIVKLEEELGKEQCKEGLILVERALRSKLNKDWQTVKAEDDEAWQDFKKTVYLAGFGNNKVVMDLLIVAANQLESTGKLLEGAGGGDELKEGDLTEKQKQQKYFPKSPDMND